MIASSSCVESIRRPSPRCWGSRTTVNSRLGCCATKNDQSWTRTLLGDKGEGAPPQASSPANLLRGPRHGKSLSNPSPIVAAASTGTRAPPPQARGQCGGTAAAHRPGTRRSPVRGGAAPPARSERGAAVASGTSASQAWSLRSCGSTATARPPCRSAAPAPGCLGYFRASQRGPTRRPPPSHAPEPSAAPATTRGGPHRSRPPRASAGMTPWLVPNPLDTGAPQAHTSVSQPPQKPPQQRPQSSPGSLKRQRHTPPRGRSSAAPRPPLAGASRHAPSRRRLIAHARDPDFLMCDDQPDDESNVSMSIRR